MSVAILSARDVLRVIHPLNAVRRLTIVLGAYLDGSGKAKSNDPVVVVAGFLADQHVWESFDARWRALLVKYEIGGKFHATNYCARARPYDRWTDLKRIEFESDVEEIFRDLQPIGVGCGISVSLFQRWRRKQSRFYQHDPYVFCVDWCMREIIRKFNQPPPALDGVAIYVDQEPEHEEIGKAVASWHEDKLRQLTWRQPGSPDPRRPVSVTYGSAIDFVPLQAADILSHLEFQRMRDAETIYGPTEMPTFGRVLKAAKTSVNMTEFQDMATLDILMRAGERYDRQTQRRFGLRERDGFEEDYED